MDKQEAYTLKRELQQFTGSEHFYQHSVFRKFIYTEGAQYLAEQAGAYWLLDYIFSSQYLPSLGQESFQVWRLTVEENRKAIITVEDGNKHFLNIFHIEFTDFPLEEFSLWLVDRTLMLPSEY
jgi:hypothetical protein